MGVFNTLFSLMMLFPTITPIIPMVEETMQPQIEIMVVGDIMMHTPVTNAGYNPVTKEYNYDTYFDEVKSIFAQADWVIGNLETPLAGQAMGYNGYPRFNAPMEIAQSLKEAGVDVLTTANNHSLDQFEKGLVKTLDHLDELEILHTGTFRTEEERNKPLILEKKGISIGVIAYTYGTNGIPLPKNKPYMVNVYNLEKIKEDLKKLEEAEVDYIVAMIHYGDEYQRFPSETQKQWTSELMELGVDFVLGSHPHVVQPLEILNGKGVIYSLGNFISDQRWEWKDYGTILYLHLQKDAIKNRVELVEADAIPTYVLKTRTQGKINYRILPLKEKNPLIEEEVWLKGQELFEHIFGIKKITSN